MSGDKTCLVDSGYCRWANGERLETYKDRLLNINTTGNYVCVARNRKGSAISSFVIQVFVSLNAECGYSARTKTASELLTGF